MVFSIKAAELSVPVITEDEFIKSFDYFFELSEEDKKIMKEKAKSLVVDKYSSEKYYQRMLDVYNRALRKCW